MKQTGIKSLNDVCEMIIDCEHKTAPIQETGYPSIRTPNIGKGRLLLENVNKVSEETYKEWTKRAVPQAEDLILAREAPVGNVAIIPKSLKVCLGQRTVLIRANKERVNPHFLVYLLLGNEIQGKIRSISNGATVHHFNMKDIRDLELPEIPPLETQTKIASTLSNYDDLIENNTRRIEILEEMAKLVYDEWFVKYRFPGHENIKMVPSELGEIPEGWEFKKLPDLCNKVIDGTHDSPKPSENGYFLVTGKHIVNGFIDFTECYRISPDEHVKVIQRSKPEKGDIIFSNIGTLGSTTLVDQDFEFSIKNVALFKPLEDFYSNYLYLHFSSPETYEQMMRKASGTSQKFFSLNFLRNLEIIDPPKNLLQEFDKIVKPLIEERSLLNKKNLNLRKTRNLLLPKLISGEIDVSDLDIHIRSELEES